MKKQQRSSGRAWKLALLTGCLLLTMVQATAAQVERAWFTIEGVT